MADLVMTDTQPRPAIGITTYAEPSTQHMPDAALRRALVILSDGREARLLFWGTRPPATRAQILLGGRHYMIDQADVVLVALDGQRDGDPF